MMPSSWATPSSRKIPISKERQERLLHEQIWEITEGISEVESSGGERFTVKQLERTKKSLEARLEKLQAEGRKDDVVTFEQLGVDRLFVDEAHNYKNPVSLHQDAQRGGPLHHGRTEIFGYVRQVPLHGRDHRRARCSFCHRHAGFQQHDRALHHAAVSPI